MCCMKSKINPRFYLIILIWILTFKCKVIGKTVVKVTTFISGILKDRGERGRTATHIYMAIGWCFHYFFQTWILSWMYRTRIQKHSPLPLKFKPAEFFKKNDIYGENQTKWKIPYLEIRLFIQKRSAKI